MRRDLSAPLIAVPWPEGVTRVPLTTERAPLCRKLMNEAYSEGYGDVRTYVEWWPSTTARPEWDPNLCYLAAEDDEIVGFCHSWTDNFIKDLVVARRWRRRGLGSALLSEALALYAARGAASVDLKTDVDNLTAQSLYKSLGFVIVERAPITQA